jgi:hypothetical protein
MYKTENIELNDILFSTLIHSSNINTGKTLNFKFGVGNNRQEMSY